jgi:hypothetical protein
MRWKKEEEKGVGKIGEYFEKKEESQKTVAYCEKKNMWKDCKKDEWYDRKEMENNSNRKTWNRRRER